MTGPATPLLKLDRLPRTADGHSWADFAELLCLVSVDGLLAPADLIDRWSELSDVGEGPVDLDVDDADEAGDMAGTPPTGGVRAADTDGMERHVGDVFRILEYRAGQFRSSYPFVVTQSGSLRRKRSLASAGPRLYVFLLMAACLKYVRRSSQPILTKAMEVVAYEATRTWLPEDAEVHIFGTARRGGRGGHFSTNLFTRLGTLAADLGERVLARETDIAPTDAGDAGLDVVGWLPFKDDPNSGYPVFMIQVTCAEDWRAKQGEVSRDRWDGYMTLKADPVRMLFTPQCPRKATGEWERTLWVEKTVLLDRLRLEWIVARGRQAVSAVVPVQLVDEVLGLREGIV